MDAQPNKVLVWNVQGLNTPVRRTAICQVVVAAKPSVVCFQESKLEVVTLDVIRHCMGNRFEDFFYLPADGTRGGIILAWDATQVALSNPHYTDNTLTVLVKPHDGSHWWLTGVYGPHLDAEKVAFMEELCEIRDLHAGPWSIVGDFNLILNPGDKNNHAINRRIMSRFRSTLNRLELKELYINGRWYKWSNERRNPTMEKIHHIFVSNSWEDIHPQKPIDGYGLGGMGSLSSSCGS